VAEEPEPTEPEPPPGDPPVLSYFGPTVAPAGSDASGIRRTGDPLRLVTILRADGMEAQLARAKLESEGVRAVVIDENVSSIHPLLFRNVQLQVAEVDLDRAKEILAKPAAIEPDEVDENEGYVDETFRCPKCHRKAVELIPLSNAALGTRGGCLIVLLLPVLPFVLSWFLPDPSLARRLEHQLDNWRWLWLLMLCVLISANIMLRRRKRCEQCGHEW